MQVAYSPNGKYLVTGHHDGTVNLIDAETNKSITKMASAHAKPVRGLCFSPDSRMIISGSEDMHVHMYEVGSHNLVASVAGHSSWVRALGGTSVGVMCVCMLGLSLCLYFLICLSID